MATIPVSLQYFEPEGPRGRIPLLVKYDTPILPGEYPLLPDPNPEAENAPLNKKVIIKRLTHAVESRVARLLNVEQTGKKSVLKKYRDEGEAQVTTDQ
jgi:hypothetical protein